MARGNPASCFITGGGIISVTQTTLADSEHLVKDLPLGNRRDDRNDRCARSDYRGLVSRISDEVRPRVALVPGERPDGETLEGMINLVCSDRFTDLGEDATYQSTFLEIARRPEA